LYGRQSCNANSTNRSLSWQVIGKKSVWDDLRGFTMAHYSPVAVSYFAAQRDRFNILYAQENSFRQHAEEA
jgi:hypothetical protein